MSRHFFVTLATNDTYCMGALVMGNSFRNVKTTADLVVIITSEVSERMRALLADVFDVVKEVDVVQGSDQELLAKINRPEWGVCMTKIMVWKMTEYSKGVYIDSDAMALKNCDELFDYPELSACPDMGWPDIFNSGVFVFEPNEKTYDALVEKIAENVSFDCADQGLLNCYFSNWFNEKEKHLSFIYNTGTLAAYSYPPAFKRFGHNSKIVHFLGGIKPWEYGYNPETREVIQPPGTRPTQPQEHLQMWWRVFMNDVYPKLSDNCTGLAGKLASLGLAEHEYKGVEGLNRKQGTVYFARRDYPTINYEKSIGG